MTNKSIDFIHKYCSFSDEEAVWILTIMSRSKDNSPGYHDILRRYILAKYSDIDDIVEEINQITSVQGTVYRAYISANSRNVVKTLFSFQKKLIEIAENIVRHDIVNDAKNLSGAWKTELAQMENRATKRYMFDVDNADAKVNEDIVFGLIKMGVKIHVAIPTVSGYAIVFDGCDTRELLNKYEKMGVTLLKDGQLFVESWKA